MNTLRDQIISMVHRHLHSGESPLYTVSWNGRFYSSHDKCDLVNQVMREEYPHVHEEG